MNIGVIVDGDSEFRALPRLRDTIQDSTSNRFMKPVLLGTSPLASLPKLAAECCRAALLLRDRGAHLVLVLVDREMRDDCPTAIASELSAAINRRGVADLVVEVVIKDRVFENWLVADPNAIASLRGRFSPDGAEAIARAVVPGRADTVDGYALLKQATPRSDYSKVRDAEQILARADIRTRGRNSRSFRCFLQRVGHPDYPDHSRQPAAE